MSDQKESSPEGVWEQHLYKILSSAAFLLLGIGTVGYYFLEDWTWIDSFYFSAVAVTTVGFGDLVPSTDASKLFTVAYIFGGLGIISTFIDLRLKHHGRRRIARPE